MSTKYDGGAAFPGNPTYREYGDRGKVVETSNPGMSLRDWFAGMAMQGFLTRNEAHPGKNYWAHASYKAADAMLKQREKPEGGEKDDESKAV